MKSTVLQYTSWHTGAGIAQTGKSYQLEEGEHVGDGRAEGSSATGDGKHIGLFESSQLEETQCTCISLTTSSMKTDTEALSKLPMITQLGSRRAEI